MVEVVIGRATADIDAALRRPIETDQEIEEGRFPAAGLTDDGHHVAAANLEIEHLDGRDRLAGIGLTEHLVQSADVDIGGRSLHVRHRSMRFSIAFTTPSAINSVTTRTSVQANTSATENSSCASTRP